MITQVRVSGRALKELSRLPSYIQDKFYRWTQLVSEVGLESVRKIPGFHDEPLKGDRAGQRSVRLNKAYRAIYKIGKNGSVEFVSVEEVNKHDY